MQIFFFESQNWWQFESPPKNLFLLKKIFPLLSPYSTKKGIPPIRTGLTNFKNFFWSPSKTLHCGPPGPPKKTVGMQSPLFPTALGRGCKGAPLHHIFPPNFKPNPNPPKGFFRIWGKEALFTPFSFEERVSPFTIQFGDFFPFWGFFFKNLWKNF